MNPFSIVFKSRRYASLVCIAFLTIAGNAKAQGIPTYDAANYANMIQTLNAWQQQITAMKQQYDQAVSQYQALTGMRGYGSLLSNPMLQQYLPADLRATYAGITSGNGSLALSSAAQATRDQNTIFNCQAVPVGVLQNQCMSSLNKNYADQDMFQQAYAQVQLEDQRIAALMAQINQTQDPKAIAELQARLTAEQAIQQNAMTKMQIATQLAQTENNLINQKRTEYYQNSLSQTGTVTYQPPSFSLSQ